MPMIKTKDEWERVKVVADSQSGPSLQHAVDTIEALREAARQLPKAHNPVRCEHSRIVRAQIGDYMHTDGPEPCEVCDASAALPEWITENDR